VIFGQNMIVLDFALSRTAARDWSEGDRILVSRLDHDGACRRGWSSPPTAASSRLGRCDP
jgi:selenocysteine lyase/cysteine desulfurase